MSRLKRIQDIERLKTILSDLAQSQCSLSEVEITSLNNAVIKLDKLRKWKGLTDKHFKQEIVEILALINQFFTA